MEASRTYANQQVRFEMLTPAGLEVQIFVDPKEAKNAPTALTEKIRGFFENTVCHPSPLNSYYDFIKILINHNPSHSRGVKNNSSFKNQF